MTGVSAYSHTVADLGSEGLLIERVIVKYNVVD